MDTYFKGKRILVTGGCQGIGRGIVLELWRLGANVVTLSNNPGNLQELNKDYPSIEVVAIDLRNWDRTRKVVEGLGVFDGLVNNAGINIVEPFLECEPDTFDDIIAVNTKSVLNVSQIIANKMIENRIKGSIVNISSNASQAALVDHIAYCASKAAVDSMTRVMALELGPHGIRVNSVNPTIIMTHMGREIWSNPAVTQPMLDKIPLGRFAEIEDVVGPVLFLLSDKASMINGITMPVDGGFLAT